MLLQKTSYSFGEMIHGWQILQELGALQTVYIF